MTQFSVRRLARFVSRRPNWCLLIAFVLTLIALTGALDLRIEMDMSELLPEDSEVAQIRRRVMVDYGSFDFMLAVLETEEPGGEEMLIEAAKKLAFALDDDRFFSSIVYRLDPESLELGTEEGNSRSIALLTEEDWDVLDGKFSRPHIDAVMMRLLGLLNGPITQSQRRRLLEDPLHLADVLQERIRVMSGPLKVNLRGNHFMSEDGQMLLMLLWPVKPATDLAFAGDLDEFLDNPGDPDKPGVRQGLFLRNPQWREGRDFTLSFFGSHFETISDQRVLRGDFFRTSIASFIAVVCLFFFAFRRPEALFFVAIPLILGVIWTLGAASVWPGRLTQVTIAFSAILIGLGVDFSIHLYNRYLEELRMGRENREALTQAVVETGPGIIAGAITTAIAFLGMMWTSFVGFRELGFVAGVGVICCLLAVMLTLPPMLAYLGSNKRVGGFTRRPMSTFGLRRVYFMAAAYPRVTVIAGLVICIFLGLQARGVPFENDFQALKQPSDKYVALHDRISERFQVPSTQVIVVVNGATLEEALAENDRLYNNILAAEASFPLIAKDSLRFFFPSKETQWRQLQRMADQNLVRLRSQIGESATGVKINPVVFEPFLERVESFQESATKAMESEEPPISLATLSDDAYRMLIEETQHYINRSEDGRWRIVTRIYPPSNDQWNTGIPAAFIDFLDNELHNPPEITGSVIIQEELQRLILRDLARIVLVILIAVLAYLVIYFESLIKALLAILPVIMSMMCMLGVLNIFGMHLNYINILALPMIVGIGLDAGIHILQRFYEGDSQNLMLAVTRTGRAVMMTGMTTIFGFGSLALANFRGLRELGLLAIIGVSFTMFAGLLFLPALLRLLDPRVKWQGGPGDDLG